MSSELSKYKKGELSEAEAAQVEAELTHLREYFDYIQEEELSEGLFQEGEAVEGLTQETVGMKKSLRKRWLKTAAIIGTLVLLVLSLVVFGVPKLIDHLYPDPTEGKTWSRPSDFELYTWVENQISASSSPLNNVTAYKIGAGKYQIDQTYYSQFSGKLFTESFRLNRGEMEDYRHEGGATLLGEGSLGPMGYYNKNADGSRSWDTLLQQVSELPESSWIDVEMMLSEPLDLEGVRSLAETTEDTEVLSGKLEYNEKQDYSENVWGVRFARNRFLSGIPADWDGTAFKQKLDKQYPMLTREEAITLDTKEADIKTFLCSNLQYLIDHQDADLTTQWQKKSFEEFQTSLPDSAGVDSSSMEFFSVEKSEAFIKKWQKEPLKFTSLEVVVKKKDLQKVLESNQVTSVRLNDVSLISLNLGEQELGE